MLYKHLKDELSYLVEKINLQTEVFKWQLLTYYYYTQSDQLWIALKLNIETIMMNYSFHFCMIIILQPSNSLVKCNSYKHNSDIHHIILSADLWIVSI